MKVIKRKRKAVPRGSGHYMKMAGFSFHPETIDRMKVVLSQTSVSTSAFVEAVLIGALDKVADGTIDPSFLVHCTFNPHATANTSSDDQDQDQDQDQDKE